MKPGRIIPPVMVGALVWNLASSRSTKECTAPPCFDLNVWLPRDEPHLPDSNSSSPDEYTGNTFGFTGGNGNNNNNGGTVSITGGMNWQSS